MTADERGPYRLRRAGACFAVTVPTGYRSLIRLARRTDQALLAASIRLDPDGRPVLEYRPTTEAAAEALATDHYASAALAQFPKENR